MSWHGIETIKQAQKSIRAIERCFKDIELAIHTLKSEAIEVDSPTLTRQVADLENGMEMARFDSCLDTFRDDCNQALNDWDGEEEFWRRFDLTCRVTV